MVKRAPLAIPCRSVRSGSLAQPFHRSGGSLDDVTKLRVMLDLEAGHTVALCVVELQLGQHPTTVVAQAAFGVEFGVEARADRVAVLEPVRGWIGECRG